MKQQEISTIRTHKLAYYHTFIPKTTNTQKKTLKCNQSLQQVRNIAVNNQKLQRQVAIYEWRTKTQFPIVKIIDFKLIQKKTNTSILEIRKQKYRCRLKNCKQLPLFKVMYLLKESIIGFQRLYNKFGPFFVTSSMVAIDNSHKCRVWMNQNYESNSFMPLKMNQVTFLNEIYRLFESKSNHLKNTSHFYQQIQACKTFCETLNVIQNFSKQNKIVISTSCNLTIRQLAQQEDQIDFTASLSINKKFNFLPLSDLRISFDTASQNPLDKNRIRSNRILQNSVNTQICSSVMKQKNKKTEDTAQEASYIKSASNDAEKVDRKNELKIQQNKETIYKSELPINGNAGKGKFFVRKCNSNSIEMNSSKQKLQTEKQVNNYETMSKDKVQKVAKVFGEIDDNEDEQITKNKIQNTFLKNQWNKKFNGLLQEEGQLKHSIVNTQEKVKTKMTPIKLQLLGKITKNVYQSFINAQNLVFHELEPQTSQY